MPGDARFHDRVGLAADFFEPYKIAHHAVEAPIESVSSALVDASDFFYLKDEAGLRLDRDVSGQARGDDWPVATVFQLRGQAWTQVATSLGQVKGLPLGRFLSRQLETRCVCIEVTDDAYYSHALFDRGTTDEIYLYNMNIGMKPALKALGLEVPAEFEELDPNDLDELDEAEYSYRREGSPTPEASDLVTRLGFYLHTPFAVDGVHGIPGLEAEDLVRMDAIWITTP